MVDAYSESAYSGQYSEDGYVNTLAQHGWLRCSQAYVLVVFLTFFIHPIKFRSLFASCDKDWQLRIYKTAGNKLVREKLIQGVAGRWTITDHNLSLDNHWLIYSSITPHVYLTRTAADAPDAHHLLDFSTGEEDYAVRTNVHALLTGSLRNFRGQNSAQRLTRLCSSLSIFTRSCGLYDSREMEKRLLQAAKARFMVGVHHGIRINLTMHWRIVRTST